MALNYLNVAKNFCCLVTLSLGSLSLWNLKQEKKSKMISFSIKNKKRTYLTCQRVCAFICVCVSDPGVLTRCLFHLPVSGSQRGTQLDWFWSWMSLPSWCWRKKIKDCGGGDDPWKPSLLSATLTWQSSNAQCKTCHNVLHLSEMLKWVIHQTSVHVWLCVWAQSPHLIIRRVAKKCYMLMQRGSTDASQSASIALAEKH